MNARERNEFRDKWKADLDVWRERAHQHIDHDYQIKLEAIERIWSEDAEGLEFSLSPVEPQETPASSQTSTPASKGLPEGLTRRQALWQIILAEFQDRSFAPGEARYWYTQRYPQDNPKHLAPTISSLLREMSEKGELERVSRGEKPSDPWIYRVKEKDEETLLKP